MSTAIQRRPGGVPQQAEVASTLRSELVKRADIFEALLPPGADIDRYVELVIQTVVDNPGLLECSIDSVILAVREAASYGLEPTGLYGGAYLIPRWNKARGRKEATFLVSYRGLLELIWRADRVAAVEVHLVYANDQFLVRYGTDPLIVHEPVVNAERGELIAGYMIAELTTGQKIVPEPLTRADIDKVMRSTPGWEKPDSPWRNWYEEMARKTVLRRGVKLLPMSVTERAVLGHEDRAERELIEAPGVEVRNSRTRQLQARLAARALASGAVDEPEPVATPESPQEPQGGPPDQAPVSEVPEPEAMAPAAVCGASSPFGDAETCGLDPGHKGVHRSETATWPNR